MIDLSMQYLGLKLSGPIVVASTPLSESIDNIRQHGGCGASQSCSRRSLKSSCSGISRP